MLEYEFRRLQTTPFQHETMNNDKIRVTANIMTLVSYLQVIAVTIWQNKPFHGF
jgi:hypothetical protein